MTDEKKARRNCRRKVKYPSELRARIVGSNTTTDMLWPYQCPICRAWHLTSKQQHGTTPITNGNSGIFTCP